MMSAASAMRFRTRRHLANTGLILRQGSAFKWGFVLCFGLGLEAGLWALFESGFRFLDSFGGVGGLIIARLFSLFFMGLFLMLVASGVITSYAAMFRSDEVGFLLTRPLRISHIVCWKYLEATLLSSWAFFFIVIPFVGAYAWHNRLSLLFAFWTLLFCLPLLFLASALGAMIAMVFTRFSPGPRVLRALAVGVGALAVSALWVLFRSEGASASLRLNVMGVVPGLHLAGNPLLPSWWASEGIMAVTRGFWVRGGLLWGTLVSSALAAAVCVEWIGDATFYASWQRMGGGALGRRPAVLVEPVEDLLRFLPRDARALVMKDLRTFLRDPLQWSQFLVFFGLLGIYFANLRHVGRAFILSGHWANTVGFLNVFSVCAVMCSLGSRFVYPQLSLEGQGFWILGLSPTGMRRVLLAKFLSAAVGMTAVSVSLILISTHMLGSPPGARATALCVVGAVSLAVCGLSTGLGAVFLDLRQRNPAAIVSGLGGTLNLVFSLSFMLAAIVPFALLFHLRAAGMEGMWLTRGLWLAFAWLAAITAVAVCVPLWLGIRALKGRDY